MEKVANRQASADSKDLKKPKNYLLDKLHDLKTATIFTTLLALATPAFVPNTEAANATPHQEITQAETKKNILEIAKKGTLFDKKRLIITEIYNDNNEKIKIDVFLKPLFSSNKETVEMDYKKNKTPSFIIIHDHKSDIHFIDSNLDGKLDRVVAKNKNALNDIFNYIHLFDNADKLSEQVGQKFEENNDINILEIKYGKDGLELYAIDFNSARLTKLINSDAKKLADSFHQIFSEKIIRINAETEEMNESAREEHLREQTLKNWELKKPRAGDEVIRYMSSEKKPTWIDNIPKPEKGYHFFVGLSYKYAAEQLSNNDAEDDARQQISKFYKNENVIHAESLERYVVKYKSGVAKEGSRNSYYLTYVLMRVPDDLNKMK